MADRLSPERRSWLMARVRGKDTTPELVVRRTAHRLGYRFRLYRRDLPGKPDLAFAGRKAVIFVHGCFWHRHAGCRKATTPKTREAFWTEKFERNVDRDQKVLDELRALGWRVLTIWECETKTPDDIAKRLDDFLSGPPASG